MCGIAGFLCREALNAEASRRAVKCMALRLAHCGPDDFGEWVDAAAGIALDTGVYQLLISPTRLAINRAHSASGRYRWFNGEIYNFRALRSGLTRADTASAVTATPRSCSPPLRNGGCSAR